LPEPKWGMCKNCGHVDHADVNASFNIALRQGIGQLHADSDACKGSTDTPKDATLMNDNDFRTPHALAVGVCQCPQIEECRKV
jgi:hypothetical protein